MIVLSLDTSLTACSAAVVEPGAEGRVISASYCEPGRGHAEILLDMIDGVMSDAGTDFEDIDRQIVTVGPGSFTGVRVGLSAARGFRIAHDIPICGLSTMQAIAANLSISKTFTAASPVAVIINARRRQAYGQVFDAALKPLCTPALIAVDELDSWTRPWRQMPVTLMGSGAQLIESNGNSLPENWDVTNRGMLPDAASFGHVFGHIDPDEVPPDPLYLRQPDAKPQIIGRINS